LKYGIEYRCFTNFHIGESEEVKDKQEVKACGIVTNLKTKLDRSGKPMAFFRIDDYSGSCECLMFSKIFADCGKYVIEEEPVYIVGTIESSGDAVKLHIDKLMPIEMAREQLTQSIKININKDIISVDSLSLLKNVLIKNEGKIPVYINVYSNNSKASLYTIDKYRVNINQEFLNSLSELFGDESIVLSNK
jgi:DNA polymerase III subunit alpha